MDLSFHLQQQQLIELIRANKIEEALDFAEAFLAPIGEENPELLKELGRSNPLPWVFFLRTTHQDRRGESNKLLLLERAYLWKHSQMLNIKVFTTAKLTAFNLHDL